MKETLPKALDDLVVLDLSRLVEGAYCAKLLGGMGAEVIKIEPPDGGDPARKAGPFKDDVPDPETSALFLYLNTNKKSITLDITTRQGRSVLKQLAAGADVVVESFPPGRLAGLGLDYPALQQENPGLIMASITAFGQTGPYRDYHGGRLVGNALGGYMYLNGHPDRHPLAGGGEQPAYQGGLHGYAGVMAALLMRAQTGLGQHIDIATMECMASIHQFTINRYVYSGRIQKRVGNRYMYSHPITIYPCRDGWVSIAPSSDDQGERLLIMMEMFHLLEDPRFQTGFHRLANADAFDAEVMPWFRERTRRDIVQMCQEWRIPAAYVNNVADILQDEQYAARDYWCRLEHPRAGTLPYPRAPFRMSDTPMQPQRAPLLGEHNHEIYRERLQMPGDELAQLRGAGVI